MYVYIYIYVCVCVYMCITLGVYRYRLIPKQIETYRYIYILGELRHVYNIHVYRV